MADANFADVVRELDALESELDAVRVTVVEGEDTFSSAPAARRGALQHLELAVRHTVDAAWALIGEADWDEPEDNLDALEILVEEDVLPARLGGSLVTLAEFAAEHGEDAGWTVDGDLGAAFDRMAEGADALAEYLDFIHSFLKEWEG